MILSESLPAGICNDLLSLPADEISPNQNRFIAVHSVRYERAIAPNFN
jgi:hypothetical protein